MNPRVKTVITLLETRLHHDLSVEDMARFVNLSPSRFRHLFKDEMGLSPVQYLKRLRIQRARELVATTFLSMKEVMNKVGLRDKRHFAKDFKRTYGVTPARYRTGGEGSKTSSRAPE